jgi:UDP-N-acetylglucosamine 2-epimerase (non-hydrolysing)
MIKVLSVLGTRPEAIKMAPIIKEMEKYQGKIVSRLCVTAQHRQMLDQVLALFNISPDYDLNLMKNNQSPSQVAAAVFAGLDPILEREQPDWVLVQGDTTTVVIAALVAFYHRARVGHVEAGLRTFNKYQPFPEEINRRVATMIADLHFAPTERGRQNLLHEGVSDSCIYVTGNPVIDALRMVSSLPYDPLSGPLHNVPWDKCLILVTAHRRENFGEPLEQICLAIRDIADRHRGVVHLVYPVHLNPNVHKPVRQILGNVSGVTLVDPLGYLPFVYLLKRSKIVLTDSGGIQEEAPSLDRPVLVLRDVTERPEAVEAGAVRLIGTSRKAIVDWVEYLLGDPKEYDRMAMAVNPFGDGFASERIVRTLL